MAWGYDQHPFARSADKFRNKQKMERLQFPMMIYEVKKDLPGILRICSIVSLPDTRKMKVETGLQCLTEIIMDILVWLIKGHSQTTFFPTNQQIHTYNTRQAHNFYLPLPTTTAEKTLYPISRYETNGTISLTPSRNSQTRTHSKNISNIITSQHVTPTTRIQIPHRGVSYSLHFNFIVYFPSFSFCNPLIFLLSSSS